MKKQSGFTLIELLLVLAIIGIISAIAIPALLGQRERAKAKAVQGNIDGVAGECARVSDTLKENGSNPSALDVVNSVLALSNYNTPNAKNPYNSAIAPFGSGATSNGCVNLVAQASFNDPATNRSYPAVVITGYYLMGGTNQSIQKVVALD